MSYRAINFRDGILWNLAYSIGLDPTVELLVDQAAALTKYVNNGVRKSWDATDWPEWADIESFTPDTNHLVPYAYTPPTGLPTTISRVFKVYLLDPHVTQGSYDTPFRLLIDGIHCGFEHGTNVWLRFIVSPPVFSSDQWNPATTYAIGNLSYSPVTGETYVSLVNSNLANDPSVSPTQWSLVPFPFSLADVVLRSALADWRREWGQDEKSGQLDQLAVQEGQARAASYLAPTTDKLTDQTQPKPRYTVP